jgi:lipid II:glycine glycyltransferase (peptidoglycan interpeptide bridge formation enzyme)
VPADLAVCESADSFLQSPLWGLFKSRFGWQARAFLIDWAGFTERPLLVLCRSLAPGLSCAYIPWGPELPPDFPIADSPAALKELARTLKRFLPRNTVFIRFDPPWFVDDSRDAQTANAVPASGVAPEPPFIRASADIQPPDTVLIDLSASEEEIRAAMKPKWRYNIGLAEKRGVLVTEAGAQGLDVFYRLLEETARRDGIAIHSSAYYRALFELCETGDYRTQLRLYLARHESDALAAIAVLIRGTQATYLYGASSNIKRNLMAPYALQWQAMRDAKARGCLVYDLFGIPPSGADDHPMTGLYRFKTGFGGAIIHRPGSWDYPCMPLMYRLFSSAEKIRKSIRDKKKHRIAES